MVRIPIRREGFPLIAISAGIGVSVLYFGIGEGSWALMTLGIFLLAIAGFISFFFRDPARDVRYEMGKVLSPADGKVVESNKGKVSIFLSIFDVHVIRAPVPGRVKSIRRRAGRFLPAFRKEASELNEMVEMIISWDGEKDLTLRMIAGALARRILCWVGEGERVDAGQRIGMIVLGSRAEVAFDNLRNEVKFGDKIKGGITVIASKEGGGIGERK